MKHSLFLVEYGGYALAISCNTKASDALPVLFRTTLTSSNPVLLAKRNRLCKRKISKRPNTEVKEYIRSKTGKKIQVKDICNAFGYSKSYLSLLFKEQTSQSLAQYPVHCQIEEAKKMIRQNRYNFSEISDRSGFDNPNILRGCLSGLRD